MLYALSSQLQAVVTRCRAAFRPVRKIVAGPSIEVQQVEGRARQSRECGELLDQALPDTNPALGCLPQKYPSLTISPDPLDRDLLLLDLVIDLNGSPQTIGERCQEVLILLL
jgi:hypothetical protein